MIRQCAWCRVILEFGQSELGFGQLETEQVTHTICELCESHTQLEIPNEDIVAHMQASVSMA
jgi:hypothetical protein